MVVQEPSINRDPAKLDPEFRKRLDATLSQLGAEGTPFRLHEGWRSAERQQWLYGQGRVGVTGVPFARPGDRVTSRDGVRRPSDHQSGLAADCYPVDAATGKLIWPPPADDDPRWERYASLAEAQGLTAGYRWTSPHDPPHVELRLRK